jgi:hypothetical protein
MMTAKSAKDVELTKLCCSSRDPETLGPIVSTSTLLCTPAAPCRQK